MEREEEWNEKIEQKLFVCGTERRKMVIEKIENIETWKKKMGKYQENWNYGKFRNYEIEKY